MKKVYKISHLYTSDEKIYSEYIKSDKSLEELEDILAGLCLYIEEETDYGIYGIDEKMASYFLCKFYDCRAVKNKDIKYTEVIDLYFVRERNLLRKEELIKWLGKLLNEEYVIKLKKFFNDESIWGKEYIEYLRPEEIIKKY